MAVPGLFWIELGLGVVLLLLSAKAHGRQIRLERELEGHFEVDFMRENDPWVEALWRKDRRQYWVTFTAAAAVLGTYAAVAGLLGLPPRFGSDPFGLPAVGGVLLAVLLWAPVAAFIANGLTSAARLRRALDQNGPGGRRRERVRAERGAWLASAARGTYYFWGLVASLVALSIAAGVS